MNLEILSLPIQYETNVRKIFALAMHCTLLSLVLWSLYDEETFSGFFVPLIQDFWPIGKNSTLANIAISSQVVDNNNQRISSIYDIQMVCLLILIKWYLVFMIYRCFVCLHSAPRSSNSSLCTIYIQVHMHRMSIICYIWYNPALMSQNTIKTCQWTISSQV